MVGPKDAAHVAFTFVGDVLENDRISDLRLDEIASSPDDRRWLITVSFLRKEMASTIPYLDPILRLVRNYEVVEWATIA